MQSLSLLLRYPLDEVHRDVDPIALTEDFCASAAIRWHGMTHVPDALYVTSKWCDVLKSVGHVETAAVQAEHASAVDETDELSAGPPNANGLLATCDDDNEESCGTSDARNSCVAVHPSDGLVHDPCVHADLPHSLETELFEELDRRAKEESVLCLATDRHLRDRLYSSTSCVRNLTESTLEGHSRDSLMSVSSVDENAGDAPSCERRWLLVVGALVLQLERL